MIGKINAKKPMIYKVRERRSQNINFSLFGIIILVCIIYYDFEWYYCVIPLFIFFIAYYSYKQDTELLKKLILQKKIGNIYEIQIGKMYEQQGFKVDYRGMRLGLKDGGIDLEAWNNNKVVLIQCKNHREPIKKELLAKFIEDCKKIESNIRFDGKIVERVFASNSLLNGEAEMFLKYNSDKITFANIKANNRKMWYKGRKAQNNVNKRF